MFFAAPLSAHIRIEPGVAPTLEQAMAPVLVKLNAIAAGQPMPVPS